MSQGSRKSFQLLNRRLDSVQRGERGDRRSRTSSSARQLTVSHDDAYTYALRVAYLQYLLQPKQKRKQFVPAPKPTTRSHASSVANVADLVKEFIPGNSGSVKLPHGFRSPLEKRMTGVLMGTERAPGYNDAALKRTFGEAYTAFTDQSFRKSIDKERKLEPLILIFFSSATKACRAAPTDKPGDDHWKTLVDRHLAMFVRLVSNILRDMGSDRDKPELMSRLKTLENKLLTNDQNLFIDTGQNGGTTVEVTVPLSYDVKDMPMVQSVARIFGVSNSDVQEHIDAQRPNWTEEAALKDLKSYQHRMNSGMAGALQSRDFDVDEAYQEWKKAEAPHLSQMMMDILTANPRLNRTSTYFAAVEKPLPSSPGSSSAEDQAYSDIGRVLSSPGSEYSLDQLNLGSMTLDDTSSIRSVDEAHYTFIPPEPRAFFKTIAKYTMEFDAVHGEDSEQTGPFSDVSMDLLTELCVQWRIPQFTRLVVFLEVAAGRFLDTQFTVPDLDNAFELVKEAPPEPKKPPHIYLFNESLATIDRSKWTLHDFAVYQHTLNSLHEALLREFVTPASPHDLRRTRITRTHYGEGLQAKAAAVYRGFLEDVLPVQKEEWDFNHVVQLGKSVVKLCERIKKRYRSKPEIMGVNPLTILVETMFPSFEQDAESCIIQIIEVAQAQGVEFGSDDGFALYRELCEIRQIHHSSLPDKPFSFDIEEVLVGFVWRWIENAERLTDQIVTEAIKLDSFQVRSQGEGHITLDSERHSNSIIDMFRSFNQTADQIFQLGWDNDVHHARFMTSLSRIFANGICKYCEIVDTEFFREMNTPRTNEEAEAEAAQTTQGKFMKYAKDAWNTKDKFEPFQFYSQSLVKLNNVEYAMQELDKLEKSMNVDACAVVLEKADGLRKQAKRPNKYVFTIKIVEAEDLKACDANGTSDPYVVLGDEYQKRLAKTRVVMRSLNPRWDESVDITVTGPLNVVATIWDYDTFGDHDFVGRTSLKLDPIHFSDYLPREFWLELDTQGRILLRVSMEGERDDIQFYFGKAFRLLKRAERDMVRGITDKLTAHINSTLSHENLRNLLGRNIMQSAQIFFKRQSRVPTITSADIENALQSLFTYFNDNFAIMKQTLTEATMVAVMTRLWKEVLMAIESLLVPPLSDKPSNQKPLTERECEVVYKWLGLLFEFFNARDEDGEVLGVPAEVLKSPKYHELASLNFFYFEQTDQLIHTSERMAAATAQRQQQAMQQQLTSNPNRLSAPASFGSMGVGAGPAFASMGTIRRGKSIMMSRNLGTMRRAKEEKRKEAQADPSDDMILRILRMRPEAADYLKHRHRQKERLAAQNAAQMIWKQSVAQGWNGGGSGGFGRGGVPRR
ncbi:C2 domain protein [Apiospora hydei]|uniref:C2 domain protein n=1 Tax=Apiospora hydei TaxID=1337664 RepID=A0ABR1X0F1_9PEZI